MVTGAAMLRTTGACGEAEALYDLGVSFSTGTGGKPIDAVEAHKWFNLAAQRGSQDAATARTDLALDMSAAEIAAAQRAAREWMVGRIRSGLRLAARDDRCEFHKR